MRTIKVPLEYHFPDRLTFGEVYWITSALGTASYDDQYLLTAPRYPPGVVVVDNRNLADGQENDPKLVWRNIKIGVLAVRGGSRVISQCQAGISRSNSVAAGILAVVGHIGFQDAVHKVHVKVPHAYPHPLVLDSVKLALERYGAQLKYDYATLNPQPFTEA